MPCIHCPRLLRLASKGARLVGLIVLLAAQCQARTSPADPGPSTHFSPTLPLFFEPLPERADHPAGFVARGPNYTFRILPAELQFVLCKRQPAFPAEGVRAPRIASAAIGSPRAVRVTFVNGNEHALITGTSEMAGKVNYLLGNDPAKWRADLPMFAGVRVEAIYPGIDLAYYGNQKRLEYDFALAPGADSSRIALHFEGVDQLAVGAEGELVIGLGQDQLRQHRPVIYQIVKGERREISGGYRLLDRATAGFEIGAYDHELPLVIDPMFSYATFFGGNGGDTALSIKVDRNGSVYLAGETLSTTFPPAASTNSFQPDFRGGSVTGDAFVAKLDNTGSQLLYFTYLGGSGDDGAYDLAIDSAGHAFLTGFTVSSDFPTRNALYSQISGTPDATFHLYPTEAFVAELNPAGSGLLYSTYLGGSGNDLGSSIAVDSTGAAYVTGYSYSTNFPLVNPLKASFGGNDDAFVAKLGPGGQPLVYSTYLGGNSLDEGEGIAVDAAGFAYVSGYTASTNFPVTAGVSRTNLNGSGVSVTVYDAFVSKLSRDGRRLIYSTYLGGSQNDFGYRIAVDAGGNAFLAGATQSYDLPYTNLFGLTRGEDGTNAINFDAFLFRLDTNGLPAYAAQFGGTGNDSGWDIALDQAGRVFVIGLTTSTNFPVVSPFGLFRGTNSGGNDIFVVVFDTNAAPVLYSAYLGGPGNDYGYAIAVDSESNAYISGMTASAGFRTTPGAFQRVRDGSTDAFVAKVRLFDPMLEVQQTNAAFQISWPATAPDYSLQSTTDLSEPQVWTPVSFTPVLDNGHYTVSFPATNLSTLFRLNHH